MTEDDDLMAELRRVAGQVDPAPPHVVAAARAALSTRRLDDELAELLMDSELADQVRTVEDVRVLSFEASTVSIELQVERSTLRGLVSGASGDVVVETRDGSRTAPIEAGWFTVEDVPAGPLRIRVTAEHGTTVSTGWVTL